MIEMASRASNGYITVNIPKLGKPFRIPSKIMCNGGVLKYNNVDKDGICDYEGHVQNAFVTVIFELISANRGDGLTICFAKNKSEAYTMEYYEWSLGLRNPYAEIDGEFDLNSIPSYVVNGIAWMNQRKYLYRGSSASFLVWPKYRSSSPQLVSGKSIDTVSKRFFGDNLRLFGYGDGTYDVRKLNPKSKQYRLVGAIFKLPRM